jgi:vancomycin permeability regulator SanA
MTQRKIILFRLVCIFLILSLCAGILVLGLNGFVLLSTSSRIISPEEAQNLQDVDCILVLGCLVRSGGVPSDMLSDRLRRGVELYQSSAAPKLLMSGDHGRSDYNEVDAMKRYAVEAGIPSADIFMDHAGFSTYESVYRARDIFQCKKILIVSQEYHLHRALYIAQHLGLEAYGVASNYRSYGGQTMRDIREILARVKDIGSCILLPKPTYLGDIIPITGSGELTHDKDSQFS